MESQSEIVKVQHPKMTDAQREVWSSAQEIPCNVTLEVPVVKFTVETLLRLCQGSVLETQWNQTIDLPLRVNGEVVGWTEFEVVGERLAVRVTELE